MEIRFAKPSDVPAILDLLRQVGRLHHEGRPDIFRDRAQKYSASQVIAMLDDPQNPIFIAAEGDKVLGYGFCQILTHAKDPVMTDRTELYLDDLCVDEKGRGKGVGTALYNAIRRYAKERKCHSLSLNVWSCNKTAYQFYVNLGLVPRKTYMEDMLDAN
nr:GNAT family N-acetyltransferase [Oscillospiraceae bacterium]MBQ8245495.1 GNAT family N-acetyltransferase [Oscillospiraceae bacterium]